ncbi:MAG: hypothetical protein QN157_00485 [Armatimonadota bacterium]|nr:hypothetical protein [Armatimonadota bacterium]
MEGDAQLWQEVLEALNRLSTAHTYRMRTGPVVVEVDQRSSPPSSRMVVSSGGVQTEIVQVGDQAWMLTAGICRLLPRQQSAAMAPTRPPRPQDITGVVRILGRTPGAHTTPRGEVRPVYVYEYESDVEQPGAGRVRARTRLSVDRETTLPLRMALEPLGATPGSSTRPGTWEADFYDFGADIRITVPPECPRS